MASSVYKRTGDKDRAARGLVDGATEHRDSPAMKGSTRRRRTNQRVMWLTKRGETTVLERGTCDAMCFRDRRGYSKGLFFVVVGREGFKAHRYLYRFPFGAIEFL